MFTYFKVIVAALVLSLSCSLVYAKPAPPEELAQMLGELSEVEESFESENWTGARASLEEVVVSFSSVNGSYAEVVPAKLRSDFFATAKGLDSYLEAKDSEKVEDSFIHLQVVLFEIMGHFDYKVHPVIGVLKKYIGDEAKEALEANNFEEVHSELTEVVTFVTKNASLLQQRGVKHEDIQSFLRILGEAMQQVKAKDKVALENSLDSLEELVGVFQSAFI